MSVLKGWDRPLDKGGCPAQFFSAIRVSVWSKNKGGGAPGPSPVSASAEGTFFEPCCFPLSCSLLIVAKETIHKKYRCFFFQNPRRN